MKAQDTPGTDLSPPTSTQASQLTQGSSDCENGFYANEFYSKDFYAEYLARAGAGLSAKERLALTAMHRLQQVAMLRDKSAASVARVFQLHVQDMFILLLLERSKPDACATVTELSHALDFTSGGMTKRLDRLEAQGLVGRSAHPDDRRSVLIRLTPAGLALVGRVRAELERRQALTRVTESLDEQEWQALTSSLNQLARALVAVS